MAQDRLDSTGLTYLWGKLKAKFASQSFIGSTSMGTVASTVTGAIKEIVDKLGNTTIGTTATTITGAIAEHESDITELNSNLSWKNAGTVTGGTDTITVPAGWKEINIRLIIEGNSNRCFFFHVTNNQFAYDLSIIYGLRSGYYSNSGNHAYVQVNLTPQANTSCILLLDEAILSGTSYKNTSTLKVVYR